MVTIVRGTVPASEFALHHALQSVPESTFELERVVLTDDGAAMPLLWVRGADAERAAAAFEADSTVQAATVLAAFDGERLYRMEWVDRTELVARMLTGSGATILDAFGREGRWTIRAMYPEREALADTHEFCTDHGLSFTVESVRELDGGPAGRFGLTADQFEALTAAARRGLFAVPREVTLEELAEEFEVSHQALSERVRRATGALVADTLLVGPAE
jgi:predicted DNA binding protein